MSLSADGLNRIDKLFVDRDQLEPARMASARSSQRIALVCGLEVSASESLQAAVLTAANLANRCFPGSVSLHFWRGMNDVPLRVRWPANSFVQAVRSVAPHAVVSANVPTADQRLVFGTRTDCDHGLQVTFDGWVGAVAPAYHRLRLAERDGCVLAGVAAGALAVSEIFLSFARVLPEATYRAVGVSLWRPDLPWADAAAAANGPVAEFLPAEFWHLGLGHLGQGYLWSLGLLPYRSPGKVKLLLHDFDVVQRSNVATGMLTRARHVGLPKTRVAGRWLAARGFKPRLVERRFDEGTRRYGDEPGLALCGFDGAGPRAMLDSAGFERVVECGLGDRFDNFHSMLMHTLPLPGVSARQLWPTGAGASRSKFAEKLARENPVYRLYDEKHVCGAVEIAGQGVAVPFVGALAGSLVMAETLRMLHGGECYESIDLRCAAPQSPIARRAGRGYGEAVPAVSCQPRAAGASQPN